MHETFLYKLVLKDFIPS